MDAFHFGADEQLRFARSVPPPALEEWSNPNRITCDVEAFPVVNRKCKHTIEFFAGALEAHASKHVQNNFAVGARFELKIILFSQLSMVVDFAVTDQ